VQKSVKAATLRHLRGSPPGRILDFPAGSGWLGSELTSPGWDYEGADLYTRSDLPNFRAANLNERFPYGDDEFDYVACLEGIEHAESYHHVLRECHRVLRPEGTLLLSTPNPLNIKSRRRYYWIGTFNGFPHLSRMPAEGEHLHITPMNLSFLLAFAEKYGFELQHHHWLPIKRKAFRFVPQALSVKLYTYVRYRFKPAAHRAWMQRLSSWQVLLSDEMLLSFRKRGSARGSSRDSAPTAFARTAGPEAA